MADSTTNLDTISSGQSSKEVTANDLFDAGSPATLLGRRASTTAGLTWGYYGGVVALDAGTLLQVANGTKTLTDSATNYIELDTTDGSIDLNTTGWTAGKQRLYSVVVAGGAVTSYTDWRSVMTLGGGAGAVAADDVSIADAGGHFTGTDVEAALQELGAAVGGAPAAEDVTVADAGGYFTGAEVEAVLQEIGAALDAPPVVAATFYPGVPTASALVLLFAAPAGITTLTAAAAIAGSSGKALTAATAQTDFDVRKNATSAATGTSVGTMRFAAAGTVPTFIAASGFTLTGGTDTMSVWAPATPDATLANISASLYFTR